MNKTSKITASKFKTKWDGDKGSVYYHEIELENGDKGEIGTKEQDPAFLNVGQELTYEISEGKYGPKIKRVTEGGFKGKTYTKETHRVSSMSIAYAKDFVVSRPELKTTDMFELAQRIYDWINERP